MSMTDAELEKLAQRTAKAMRENRKDCGERSGTCLIYTDDAEKVKFHLDQHIFLGWLIGWVDPARKETKALVIKGLVLLFFIIAATVVYLIAPTSLKGIIK